MLLLLLACSGADSAPKGGASDSGDSPSPAGIREGRFFPDGAIWYQPVTDAAVDPDSDRMIATLQAAGWGAEGRFQMDFGLEVLAADATTPFETFEPKPGEFYEPDCDLVPMPVPEGGNLEAETGYACESDGDCHLLVADEASAQLYEMWRADIRGDTFRGGCLAVWNMDLVYPDEGRGVQCTSADAAGYPIAPLLFTADEVAAGRIEHAMRFALPNDLIRDGEFFAPATHATESEGGGPEALPYGARLRLKADFDLNRIADPEARVVAVALQEYGMFLADGGNIPLMGRADTRTTAKWDELFEDYTWALVGIEPEDFEVLALEGPAIPLTYECERTGL